MECCGFECVTKFCPHCGKSHGPGAPLYSLLSYLRSMEARTKACAETWARESSGTARGERADARKAKTVEKWKVWADALAMMLVKKEESQS